MEADTVFKRSSATGVRIMNRIVLVKERILFSFGNKLRCLYIWNWSFLFLFSLFFFFSFLKIYRDAELTSMFHFNYLVIFYVANQPSFSPLPTKLDPFVTKVNKWDESLMQQGNIIKCFLKSKIMSEVLDQLRNMDTSKKVACPC